MTSNQGSTSFGSGGTGNSGSGIFGTPTTSGSSTPSLFGTTSTPAQSSTTGSNAFGANANRTTGLFGGAGGNAMSNASGGGLFGSSGVSGLAPSSTPTNTTTTSTPATGGVFGGATAGAVKPVYGSTMPGSTNVFGGGSQTPASGSGIFGATPLTPSSTPGGPSNTSSGIFTNITNTKPGTPLFGATSTPTTTGAGTSTPTITTSDSSAKPAGSFFGAGTQSGNLFSGTSKTPGTADKPSGTSINFGSATSGGGFFGMGPKSASPAPPPAATGTPNLFTSGGQQTTAKPTENKPTGGLFGSAPTTASTLFGNSQQTPATKPGLFGASSAPSGIIPSTTTTTTSTSATAPSLFAQGSAAAPAQKPSSNHFGGASAETKGGNVGTPNLNLFGQTGTTNAPSTTTPHTTAAASSLFSKPATSTASSITTPSTSATAAPATTAPPSLSGGLFGTGTATTSDASRPATDTPKGMVSQMSPPTSTAPPAQSRLKNKSMEEIMSRWLNDTQKYKQQFLKQAEEIKKWDQMLVENGEKISKLFNDTVEEEKKQNRVETQLSYLENEQNELSDVLDHYEGQVKDLFEGQMGGYEGMQPADQEREKTYHLAQRLNDQLAQMNKDLEGMIVEINQASATINKTTNQDDPLSQIVRVLNNHLSALQWIDSHTTAIQERVKEAQQHTSKPSTSYMEDEFLASHATLKGLR